MPSPASGSRRARGSDSLDTVRTLFERSKIPLTRACTCKSVRCTNVRIANGKLTKQARLVMSAKGPEAAITACVADRDGFRALH
jgi:hypothetical protein